MKKNNEYKIISKNLEWNKPEILEKSLEASNVLSKFLGISENFDLPLLRNFVLSVNKIRQIISSANIEGSKMTTKNVVDFKTNQKSELKTKKSDKLEYAVLEYIYSNTAIKKVEYFIRDNGFFSTKSIKELHKNLFQELSLKTTGIISPPIGEFKTSNNNIINAKTKEVIFVPCSIQELSKEMKLFDNFFNEEDKELSLPQIIINSGIIHACFERIHPFSDGNGRVGRILIPTYFMSKGITKELEIFLDREINNDLDQYYCKLDSITKNDSYIEWLS